MRKIFISTLLFFSSSSLCAADFVPGAYMGAYLLNQDPSALQNLYKSYGIKNVNIGFIFLKEGASCTIDNISDGSVKNPILAHSSKYKKFHNMGGTIGYTISGDDQGEKYVWEPLTRCSTKELTQLLLDVVRISPVPVREIAIDIEMPAFRAGKLGADRYSVGFYDKIATALDELKNNHPNIKTLVTIPTRSDYWSKGYTPGLRNLLRYSSSVDYLSLMGSGDSLDELKKLTDSSVSFSTLPKDRVIVGLIPGNNYRNIFNGGEVTKRMSEYRYFTTIVSKYSNISSANAKLYRDMNK
ncbi:hypothetical protein [Vibrio splendidus]|uniref:hypothetical protein n=1 Tax=Vibrio splendidus TaxID=29497 RepID=UPI0003066C43|nr:hypothetical protein [Vibrio splendidus]OCH63254.1 hypothetical protein A6D94_15695 [Vibrio splendidus]